MLGTGASIGTLGTDGGVAEFVKRLIAVRGMSWRRDYPNLASVIDDCKEDTLSSGLDQIWSRIDYYSKFRGILGAEYGPETSLELHKAVLDAYSFTEEIERLSFATGKFTLKLILTELEPGDALISFNWDTLAETIAKKILGKDLAQAPYPGGERRILLIKPHGSLSWEHRPDACGKCDLVFRDGLEPRLGALNPAGIDAGGPGHHFTQPFLLGAVPIKSEILEEIQHGHDVAYRTVCSQWREVVWALARTNKLVVAGYRFPPEDAYGRFLLREAIRKRPAGTPPLEISYALHKDRSAIEDALRDIFGKAVNFKYMDKVEYAW